MLVSVSSTIFMSLRLAPSTARPMGMPLASTNWLRLTPRLARSVGFLPVFFPPERCLGHAAVHAQPGPVDPLHLVVAEQAGLPHAQEDACFDPFLEAIMGGGAGTKQGGVEGFPLAARAQDEEDGAHAHAIVGAGPPAAEAMRVAMFGQKDLDGLPQLVGQAPLRGH